IEPRWVACNSVDLLKRGSSHVSERAIRVRPKEFWGRIVMKIVIQRHHGLQPIRHLQFRVVCLGIGSKLCARRGTLAQDVPMQLEAVSGLWTEDESALVIVAVVVDKILLRIGILERQRATPI